MHHVVTGGEVREIGRLMIAFSEALGIEPNSIHSGELCQRVRDVVQERDDLKADQDQVMRTAEYFRLRNRDLSVLLRGMTQRAIQHRRYGVAMSQHSLDLARQLDALTKPNLWFTKPEFPIETAERADREAVKHASDVRQYLRINGPGTYPLQNGGSLTVRVAELPEAESRPICGQVHDSAPCTRPRVPETNGCWAHYGPDARPPTGNELDEALGMDAPTVRTDRAEEGP